MKLRILGIAAASTMLFAAALAVAEIPAETSSAATPAATTEAATPAPAVGADGFALPAQKKSLGDAPPPPADVMSPLERVKITPVGQLKNPYGSKIDDMAKWGQKRYMSNSCNGCHGGTGGGGMCPPLSNETWVYGSDDDTLFRLIALGSDELQKHLGVTRKGRENVVGPMPAFGGIIKTDDELWRIITFLRTTYRGDPSRKNW